MDQERTAALPLPACSDAPRQARDFLVTTCRSWAAGQYLDAGSLVVSELVTNAVVHAGTDMVVSLTLTDSALTVAVHDSGDGEPHIAPAEQRVLGGRGLAMVAKIAESWGVRAERSGKAVWCRLAIPAPTPGPALA